MLRDSSCKHLRHPPMGLATGRPFQSKREQNRPMDPLINHDMVTTSFTGSVNIRYILYHLPGVETTGTHNRLPTPTGTVQLSVTRQTKCWHWDQQVTSNSGGSILGTGCYYIAGPKRTSSMWFLHGNKYVTIITGSNLWMKLLGEVEPRARL